MKVELAKDGACWFECPGCGLWHRVPTQPTENKTPVWKWNGNVNKPTFSPSLLVSCASVVENVRFVCHSFIKDGNIQFFSDCTHELKGKTIEMKEIPPEGLFPEHS